MNVYSCGAQSLHTQQFLSCKEERKMQTDMQASKASSQLTQLFKKCNAKVSPKKSRFSYLSGYSSRILEMRSVPMPDPVPPPKEWVSWNPWRQSQDSDSLRTTSRTESTSSAPENSYKNQHFLKTDKNFNVCLPSV